MPINLSYWINPNGMARERAPDGCLAGLASPCKTRGWPVFAVAKNDSQPISRTLRANNEQCISLHYFICQAIWWWARKKQKSIQQTEKKNQRNKNSKQEEKKKLRRIGENRLDHVYVVHNRAQSSLSLCLSLTFCVLACCVCFSYKTIIVAS